MTFDRFHLKSGSRLTLGKVHAQLNKFLKIALLKNFMLSGMYMYSFLWFEFNYLTTGLIGSIYKIKIPITFVFSVETCAKMSRFSMGGNNGSFYGIG